MRRALLVLIIAGCSSGMNPGGPWEDPSGSELSGDLFLSFRGEQSHCGWGSATFLSIGPRAPVPGIDEAHYDQYVRDPRGLFTDLLADVFMGDIELPSDAIFTGYSTSKLRLWISPDVTSAVYLEVGDRFEQWARVKGQDPILCA
jgi:hypothetical protein